MEGLQLVWGWQPALYLFLGGVGAGAFATAAFLFLRNGKADKKVINISMWAAFVCLCVGLLLLLLDLISPLRGMMMWQSFTNFSSWMAIGAWVIFAAAAVFFVTAVLTCKPFEKWYVVRRQEKEDELSVEDEAEANLAERPAKTISLPRQWGASKLLAGIGLVLGICVAAYTGILLMSVPGVPLWGTWLLPCLFTVSAFDTGIALVELVSYFVAKKNEASKKMNRFLQRSVIVLVVLEAAVLAFFATTMLGGSVASAGGSASFAAVATNSVQLILTGELAPFFWVLVVACGLVLPLIMAIAGMASKAEKPSHAPALFGAFGALLGGCTLRFVVLFAGLHVNYVLDTIATLPF